MATTKTKKPKVPRARIAKDMPEPVDEFITYCNGLVAACTNNKWLPTSNPVLQAVVTALAVLVTAQTAAKTKAAGAATIRDGALEDCKIAVANLAAQVQGVADANRAQGSAIIVSCGFHVAGMAVRTKKQFSVKAPAAGGTAVLDALAIVGAVCYFWQMSTDSKTWTDCLPTKGSKTTVTGLMSGTTYFFRFRALLKGGYTTWSEIVDAAIQ